MRQDEISFDEQVAAPVATTEEVEWLVGLLEGKGWLTAAKLEAIAQGTKNDRKIRAIARAATPGIFSYPGSPGYKMFRECSIEEVRHGLAAMDSQIRDMTVRRACYERAFHAKSGGGI